MTRSQLKFQNLHFCNGGTPVSWFLAKSGVPSDGENPVQKSFHWHKFHFFTGRFRVFTGRNFENFVRCYAIFGALWVLGTKLRLLALPVMDVRAVEADFIKP